MDIAEIGRNHLAQALSGEMSKATVDEWLDDSGTKVVIYWRPLTGAEQKKIDGFQTNVEKICATVKFRARDADGKLIFKATPIESLIHDYEFQVLQAISFLMVTGMNQNADEKIEELAKE